MSIRTPEPAANSREILRHPLPSADDAQDDVRAPQRRQASSSAASTLVTAVLRVALLVAVVSGPAALVAVLAAPRPPAIGPAPVASSPQAPEVVVAAVAVTRVRSWLAGTNDDPFSFAAASITPAASPDASLPNADEREPVLLALDVTAGGTDTWWVTVAATSYTGTEFYGVEVEAGQDAPVTVVGLPSAIAAPVVLARDREVGSWRAPSSHPLALAVTGFLTAYLLGDGDPGRWAAPGVDLGSVAAIYEDLRVATVSSPQEVSATPADGDTATVVVAAELTSTAAPDNPASAARVDPSTSTSPTRNQILPVEYVMTLAARDTRWEITSLLPSRPTLPSPLSSQEARLTPSVRDNP